MQLLESYWSVLNYISLVKTLFECESEAFEQTKGYNTITDNMLPVKIMEQYSNSVHKLYPKWYHNILL